VRAVLNADRCLPPQYVCSHVNVLFKGSKTIILQANHKLVQFIT